MPLIAVTGSSQKGVEMYVASIERRGAAVLLATPDASLSASQMLEGVGGLLLSGGADIHPSCYGREVDPSANVQCDQARDEMELSLLRQALDLDMPVLGICRGMQLLNVGFGGSLIQDILNHRATEDGQSGIHPVFVSPGSKLGTIIGAGGNYRTNSSHHQGLKEPQRSPALLASAYAPDDGIIEGLESPAHSWVIGVQCHPERENEVPRGFLNLFGGLVEWAERFTAQERAR